MGSDLDKPALSLIQIEENLRGENLDEWLALWLASQGDSARDDAGRAQDLNSAFSRSATNIFSSD